MKECVSVKVYDAAVDDLMLTKEQLNAERLISAALAKEIQGFATENEELRGQVRYLQNELARLKGA